MSTKSPCTDICKFDKKNEWCIGCGRTAAEIKGWKKMSPKKLKKVQADLSKRIKTMGT